MVGDFKARHSSGCHCREKARPCRPKILRHDDDDDTPTCPGRTVRFHEASAQLLRIVCPVFGILTNFEQFRVAWLPDNVADSMAAEIVDFTNEDEEDPNIKIANDEGRKQPRPDGVHELRPTASRVNPIVHCVEDEESECVGSEEEDHMNSMEADTGLLHVSRVFHQSEKEALPTLFSAVVKMCNATITPFANPFDKLSEQTLLRFEKGDTSVVWIRLKNVSPRWDFLP